MKNLRNIALLGGILLLSDCTQPSTNNVTDLNQSTPSTSPTATRVYGQLGSFTTSTPDTGGRSSANGLGVTEGIAVDASGVYIVDMNNSRVLYYPGTSTTATRVYGQAGSFTTFAANNGGVTADSLSFPHDVAVDASGVYIADNQNHRVLYYPGTSTTATRVYGQAGSFTTGTSNNGGRSANSLANPQGIAVDASGVYVTDISNHRVLYYAGTSTTASRVYGQAGSFTTGTFNNGGVTANSLNQPQGIAVDASGLYVVDWNNKRVLYYAGTSTTATRVYGQAGSFTTGTSNNGGVTANSLGDPDDVAVDSSGVYVTDYSNHRVLYYPGTSTTATRVYGQFGSFTTSTTNNGGLSANSLSCIMGVAVNASGIYVADACNNRVLFY